MVQCNPFLHKSTSIELCDDQVQINVTNSTNISDLEFFQLVLCQNPNTIVTGDPIPFVINVNGENVDLLNKYGLEINSNRLKTRKLYNGRYIVKNNNNKWVILEDTPDCPQFAR